MQAKAIAYKPNDSYKFILFLVAPLILGFLITCKTAAKAEWATPDHIDNPLHQGWRLVDKPAEKDFIIKAVTPSRT